jgi:hypothetical protein
MKKNLMVFALSLLIVLSNMGTKVSASTMDGPRIIDYSSLLPSDQQLISMANNGILYSDDNVKVSKTTFKVDDFDVVRILITKRIRTEIVANVRTSFYNASSTDAITHGGVFSVGVAYMYMEYQDVNNGESHRKITAFGHSLESFESLFGAPVSLTSNAYQGGAWATQNFINYDSRSETSASLVKTSSFFTMQYSNTNFLYFIQSTIACGAGMKTIVRWRNKNGTYTNFTLNFTLYINGF